MSVADREEGSLLRSVYNCFSPKYGCFVRSAVTVFKKNGTFRVSLCSSQLLIISFLISSHVMTGNSVQGKTLKYCWERVKVVKFVVLEKHPFVAVFMNGTPPASCDSVVGQTVRNRALSYAAHSVWVTAGSSRCCRA